MVVLVRGLESEQFLHICSSVKIDFEPSQNVHVFEWTNMNDKIKINGTNMGTEKEMRYTLKGIEETSYYVLQKYTSRVQTQFRLMLYKHVYFCCGDRAVINLLFGIITRYRLSQHLHIAAK